VMDAARAVAMPSLSPATVAARPSSRRLHKVAAMATQKPTSGTRRVSLKSSSSSPWRVSL
jgi:hypothetical protein